jgi:hypothetical protein
MTALSRCPFCSSEKVYALVNTMHCKRCKNLWTPDKHNPEIIKKTEPLARSTNPAGRMVKKTAPLEIRLKQRLDEFIRKYNGRFSMDFVVWKTGDITPDLFRQYLKKCENNSILVKSNDRNGRIWYSVPEQISRHPGAPRTGSGRLSDGAMAGVPGPRVSFVPLKKGE